MADEEQQTQLERVRGRIGQAVLDFCRQRGLWAEFHADELREHVLRACQVAPGSPDRILRELRRERQVNYEVVNRKRSLYRILPVTPEFTGVLF